MSLLIDVHRPARAAAVVVDARGECDVFTAERLRTEVARQIDAGRVHLVVDLTRVTFIDSTGLGVLVRAQGLLASRDGHLDLVVAGGSVRRLLRISSLAHLFHIHRSLEDALTTCWSRSTGSATATGAGAQERGGGR